MNTHLVVYYWTLTDADMLRADVYRLPTDQAAPTSKQDGYVEQTGAPTLTSLLHIINDAIRQRGEDLDVRQVADEEYAL